MAALGLIAGSLLAGGSWLAGKSSGGGAIEIGTSKKQQSEINVIAPFSPFIYSPTNAQDYSTNVISGSTNASISTKKEGAVTGATTPISYSLPIETGQTQGSGSGTGEASGSSSFDYMTLVVIGGFALGGYMLLSKSKKGDKK